MRGPAEDWGAVVERLLAGDRLAFLQLNRLVTGCLTQLRAYDFQEEWDDLRQEVVMAVIANARSGRLRDPRAFVGYVRIITRNKVMDRLRQRLDHHEKEHLPWDDATAGAGAAAMTGGSGAGAGGIGSGVGDPGGDDAIDAVTLRAALADLSRDERRVVDGVYVEGKTYEEVSAETGIPLGTMKRRLRDALTTLRRRLLEPGPSPRRSQPPERG